jgi:hypothetical protein
VLDAQLTTKRGFQHNASTTNVCLGFTTRTDKKSTPYAPRDAHPSRLKIKLRKLSKKNLGLLQILEFKPLGGPTVDVGQHVACFVEFGA